MSDNLPKIVTGPMNKDEESEEERLRIRKNSTTANIPPPSPELAPPHIDNSDEQCKPVSLPRPITL